MSSPSRWRPNAFEVLAATLEPHRCCCQGLLRRRPWWLTNRERMRGVEDGAAAATVKAVAKREECCFTPHRQSLPFRVTVVPPVKRSGRRKPKLVEQWGKPPSIMPPPTAKSAPTSGFWNLARTPLPLAMGCRETMLPSLEEHCRGHLSRVEGGRAVGGRHTLPPSPLPPKTVAESSVSGFGVVFAFRARSCSCLILSFH
ncbi:uncharacterized protein LOC130940988 [Arachis stenosperma]|uniref:uncharacterized protein LOC130940988 n=1 Tax=Arachis stenosperma TaxID=217475 RepID=UPI0025AD8413|nr:uncharacterized protein LOC130940988 [Arachis stenosperma]